MKFSCANTQRKMPWENEERRFNRYSVMEIREERSERESGGETHDCESPLKIKFTAY